MALEDYSEPKGAYYNPALVARYPSAPAAEAALSALRDAGFTTRDIQVARSADDVTVIVSEPTPGMLEEARRILLDSGASDVHPYGAGGDSV